MTIAIDASRAVNESAGIGRHTKELVKHLLKVGKEHKFILIFTYYRADLAKDKIIKSFLGDNIEVRVAKIPGVLKETLLRKKSKLYNRLYQGADVVLAPSFLEFKKGLVIPQITIIYDMTTFLFPNQRGVSVSKRLSNQTLLVMKESKKIIAISKSTKKDIIEKIQSPNDKYQIKSKIQIVYPGLTEFQEIASDLPKKYNLKPKKYILSVGTIEPRKNLKNLLIAYSLLPLAVKAKYPLVIVGASGWNNEAELKAMGDIAGVKWLGFVSDQDLAKLYREAAVFVYPSLYEGFGFPIIEAMQFGTPVITSNVSSMPEAAGAAGVLINPNKPEAIAGALQSVLGGKISRSQLAKAGKTQAKKFSWEKSAEEVLEVLEETI